MVVCYASATGRMVVCYASTTGRMPVPQDLNIYLKFQIFTQQRRYDRPQVKSPPYGRGSGLPAFFKEKKIS
jgi:hypothetical protein